MLKNALLALLPWKLFIDPRMVAAGAYPETTAALETAYQREVNAQQMYLSFSHKAKADGYDGVSYLFFALAASEQIHGRNFQRILESLGTRPQYSPAPVTPLSTKENLIVAANDEIDTIDNLYPQTLKRIEPEGHPEAVAYVTYAWQSEKQHRDMIEKVQAYSEDFFDKVVQTINEFTSRYFICQNCGSTLKDLPSGNCPICDQPSGSYRKIDRPA
ncbi:MAG TPA: ferritin family protein [Gammaproteobacteria bacterium]|nr:ferritin family protein [Gammaproteobacteria bacterium]